MKDDAQQHFFKAAFVDVGKNVCQGRVLARCLGKMSVANGTVVFTIPERFSFDEDTSLKVFLRENTTASVEIIARNLRKVDSLLMQYLIAASRTWQNAGLKFELTQLPSDIGASMALLGIDENTLCWKVAA